MRPPFSSIYLAILCLGMLGVNSPSSPAAVIGPYEQHEAGREGRGAYRRVSRGVRSIWRHYEERQRRSNLGRFGLAGSGLLRFARNDTCDERRGHHCEEIFGRVAPLYGFKTDAWAIKDGQRHPHPNPPRMRGGGSPP